MKIGRKIGEGSNSEIFEYENDNKIIKLAKPNTHKETIQREFNNSLIVSKVGLPVPKPYQVVEINERPGIVFERIYGVPIKQHLFENLFNLLNGNEQQDSWDVITSIARILSEVHQISNDELPSQRDSIKYQILRVDYLSNSEKNAVIGMLERLPIDNKICHGDPNPDNILVSNEKIVLIDWNDTTKGNPEADIAEFVIMIKFAILPLDIPQEIVRIFDSLRESIIKVFMDEYTRLTGITYDDIDPWIAPIAARKLSADAISEEEKQLLTNEIRLRLGSKQ